MSKTYYEILGVSKEASFDEIRLAYKKLAARYHPDRTSASLGDTTDIMSEINVAYDTLSNNTLRQAYDLSLDTENSFNDDFTRSDNSANATDYDYDYDYDYNYNDDEVPPPEQELTPQAPIRRPWFTKFLFLFNPYLWLGLFALVTFMVLGSLGYEDSQNRTVPSEKLTVAEEPEAPVYKHQTQPTTKSFRNVPF